MELELELEPEPELLLELLPGLQREQVQERRPGPGLVQVREVYQEQEHPLVGLLELLLLYPQLL